MLGARHGSKQSNASDSAGSFHFTSQSQLKNPARKRRREPCKEIHVLGYPDCLSCLSKGYSDGIC